MSAEEQNPDDLQSAMRVVRGNPTDDELAVVIALLQQAHSEEAALGTRVVNQPKSTWGRNTSLLRQTMSSGFGQWTASSRPGLW